MTDRMPKILAIDDTPANLLTIGNVLGAEFDLQVTTSGAAGLAQAIASPPDLILLDILLPGTSGWDMLAQLKADARTRDVPVIIVSAIDERAKALALGAIDCQVKPVSRQQLQQALARAAARPARAGAPSRRGGQRGCARRGAGG